MIITWCKCGRQILTTGQVEKNEPCELCQKEEHARTLKNRVENEIKKEDVNV